MKKIFTSLLFLIAFQLSLYAETEILTCSKGTISNNEMSFETTNFNIVHSKGEGTAFAVYSPWRVYVNNTIRIVSKSDDIIITKIELKHYNAYYGTITSTLGNVKMATSQGGITSVDIPDELVATNVTLKNTNKNNQTRLESISITYSIASTSSVATPSIDTAAGTYYNPFDVTLSCETEGAAIYYTTNGDAPTAASTQYTADTPITISKSCTLKAVAIKDGELSAIATAAYTLKAATPTATPVAGSFNDLFTVELATTTADAAIYYTLDGVDPTAESSKYVVGTPINIQKSCTLKAIAIKDEMYSDIASFKYTITLATPTISEDAGTYYNPIDVTLATETTNADIYYTTDGTAPTAATGTKYDAATPIKIESTCTLKAITVKGEATSSVASAKYTIEVANPTFGTTAEGTYYNSVNVSLESVTKVAEIYYTIDGSNPTKENGTKYTSTIEINKTCTLKAIAINGESSSDVVSAEYIIKVSTPVALAATNITTNSFTANWEACNNTKNYQLDVISKAEVSGEKGTQTNPYTVNECRAGAATTPSRGWVAGYIVGYLKDNINNLVTTNCKNSNIAIASTPDETNGNNCVPIQLSSTSIKEALGLDVHPEFIGKYVKLYGSFESYFSVNGVKSTSDYEFAEPYTVVVGSPFTIAPTETSYAVTGLDAATEYTYTVKAIGNEGINDSEFSNEINVTTLAGIVEVNDNLGEVLTNGVVGTKYKVNVPLVAVYTDGTTTYAATQQGVCSNPSIPAEGGHDSYEDDAAKFDQRDWIALTNANISVGQEFEAGIEGVYTDAANPTLDVTLATSTVDATLPQENLYQVCNFGQYTVGEDYKPFWVAPKVNEIANVVGKIIDMGSTTKEFYLYDALEDWFLPIKENPTITLADSEKYVTFKAIVKHDDNGAYTIYPLSMPQIATGVETVSNAGKATVIGLDGAVKVIAQDGANIAIYTTSGLLVNSTEIGAAAVETISLPAGIYVVKVNATATKVIVK